MEFINFEASVDQQNDELIFLDDDNNNDKDTGKVDDNFLDDSEQRNEADLSFTGDLPTEQKILGLLFMKRVMMKHFQTQGIYSQGKSDFR